MYSVNGVKSFRGHDGNGFNANLLKYGKKIAFVQDMASGGCYDFHFVDGWKCQDAQDFENYIKSLPEVDTDWGKMKQNADMFVAKLVGKFEDDRNVKRWCKTQVVFTVKSDKLGEYRTLKMLYKGNEVKVKEYIENKYGKEYEILNERYL